MAYFAYGSVASPDIASCKGPNTFVICSSASNSNCCWLLCIFNHRMVCKIKAEMAEVDFHNRNLGNGLVFIRSCSRNLKGAKPVFWFYDAWPVGICDDLDSR